MFGVLRVTAQAGKTAAMADHAGRLVEFFSRAAVALQIIGGVGYRFQVLARIMTGFATERILNLGMANQAIGHLRQRAAGYGVRVRHATMTRSARIIAVEMPANIAGVGKICLSVDCSTQ